MTFPRLTRRTLTGLALAAALFVGAGAMAQTAQAFPDVAGWTKGEVRTFDAAHLYEYIDGDAERYVKAGVKTTSTADYTFKDKTDAVADVYTMADAKGAKAILDGEDTGNASPVKVGDDGRAWGQNVVFRKGPYLVRVVAYKDTPEVRQGLADLAKAIAGRLK